MKIGALVAFSGELPDPADPQTRLSENSPRLNPALKGRDIAKAFDTDEYKILLVADKYQTGFDQPLLVAMYVDKKLEGVAAVQTLSRLNRVHSGKTQTFVLDFRNDPEEILKAFRDYYREATLADVSDPNILFNLQESLDKEQIYLPEEIDAFIEAWLKRRGKTQKALHPIIDAAVERFTAREKAVRQNRDTKALDTLQLFRKNLGSFVRSYDFLSQIIDYSDTDLEKRSIYYRCLSEKLKPQYREDPIDLSAVVLTHYRLKDSGKQTLSLIRGAHVVDNISVTVFVRDKYAEDFLYAAFGQRRVFGKSGKYRKRGNRTFCLRRCVSYSTTLHEDNGVMPIASFRRRRQPCNIFCFCRFNTDSKENADIWWHSSAIICP